ncbi:MAG: hypothetical protein V3V31_10900 [Methylococcales bacterium]
MADLVRGVLVWRGTMGLPPGNLAYSGFVELTSHAALNTFRTNMLSHSTCNVLEDTSIWTWVRDPAIPGVKANVDAKAKVFFRDPDTLKVLNFTYPAFVLGDTISKPAGLRLKDSVVVDIVGYINTATGKSYEPLYGITYQRS